MKEQGEKVSDSMVVTKILMTLPESYSHFYSAWESTVKDQQTLTNLTSRLMMEEARLKNLNSVTDVESGALVANKFNRFANKNKGKGSAGASKPGQCFYCKQRGHWINDCPMRRKKKPELKASRLRVMHLSVCPVQHQTLKTTNGFWTLPLATIC